MSKSNQAFSAQYNYSASDDGEDDSEGDDSMNEDEMYDEGSDVASDDGDEVCDICRSGDSCPEDVIIFCDSCSVPVHASCYTLKSIPTSDEPW